MGVARATVRAALRGIRPDAMLVHQAQLAAMADVWHVHYLSRSALSLRGPRLAGLRNRINDVQAAGVGLLEDRYLRRLPDRTRVLFCSDGLRNDYREIYGEPRNAGVLYNPALRHASPSPTPLPDRGMRDKLVEGHLGPVIGFLGGGSPRKGGDLILKAMLAAPELFLLHAGPSALDDSDPRLLGRTKGLGHVADVNEVLDAIDVLVVPSRFEPFGMVVTEAAARGVPVLVSERVGAAALVVECGAGAVWDPSENLGQAVARLIADRHRIAVGGQRLVARLAPAQLADQLFADLDLAAGRNQARRA